MNEPDVAPSIEGKKVTPPLPASGCGCILFLAAMLALIIGINLYQFLQIPQKVEQKANQALCSMVGEAVEQFHKKNSRLPLPSGPPPQGGDRDTDTATTHGFIAVLLGHETEGGSPQNPNRTNFLEWIKPAKPKPSDESPWRSGIVDDPVKGAYGIVDSYGKPFRIRLDANGDKQVANPDPDEVAEGRPTLSKRVIVWGAGKDGKWETWDDNPKSWE